MNTGNPFTGRSVAITGKLDNYTRAGIKTRLLEMGAKPVSRVSSRTGYLIVGERPGSKLDKAGLDAYMVFAKSLIDVNNKVLRTVKGRTHFISCAYFCCLAVENGVSQDEISRILTEFFSGYPSKSSEYNHTVSAGSAKPTSVQTRRAVIWSLLPVADEVEGTDPEENDPDDMDDTEQFEEGNYAV